MDRISCLPDNLIALILEKLSIIDRVVTSSLSRDWRCRWTFVQSLVLDETFYDSVWMSAKLPLEHANIVNSLLLQHGGDLKEFFLFIPPVDDDDDEGAPHSIYLPSISFVTKSKNLEILSLRAEQCRMTVPSSIFFAVKLRRLEIVGIKFLEFRPPPTQPSCVGGGFPNLTCLVLAKTTVALDSISHFVSACPQLEEITFDNVKFVQFVGQCHLDLKAPKLSRLCVDATMVDISVAYPQCLKSISISFGCALYLYRSPTSRSPIRLNFFINALQLQHISLNGLACTVLRKCIPLHKFPIFSQVKTLRFEDMSLKGSLYPLRIFLTLCACCPNVRNIHLQFMNTIGTNTDVSKLESMCEGYINTDMGILVHVDLYFITMGRIEMKIIELLLRVSPELDVMDIYTDDKDMKKRNLRKQIMASVKNFYRESTKAEVSMTSKGKRYVIV